MVNQSVSKVLTKYSCILFARRRFFETPEIVIQYQVNYVYTKSCNLSLLCPVVLLYLLGMLVEEGTLTQHPRPNLYENGVCRFWLIFILHFVTDSKGKNNINCLKSEKNGKLYFTSFRH